MTFPTYPSNNTSWTENNIKYIYSSATNSWRRDFNNVLDKLVIGGLYPATSTVTGALQVVGGVGIQGDLYASNIFSNGHQVLTTATGGLSAFGVSSIIAGTGTFINTSTGDVTIWVTSGSGGSGGTGGGSGGTGTNMTLQDVTNNGAITTRAISITNSTDSTGTISGALTVLGGVGIGGNLNVGGNGQFSATGITVGSTVISSFASTTISSSSVQNLDTFSTSTFRSARYVFEISDIVNSGTSVRVHVAEMNIFHDNIYVYLNEYGIASSSGSLGNFDATLISGIVTVNFTPNYIPTSMTIKGNRTAINR